MSNVLLTILAIIVWEASRKMSFKIHQLELWLPHDAALQRGWNQVDQIALQLIVLGAIRIMCVASCVFRAIQLL